MQKQANQNLQSMHQLNYNSNSSQSNLMKSKSMAQIKTNQESQGVKPGMVSSRLNHNPLRAERGKATRPP